MFSFNKLLIYKMFSYFLLYFMKTKNGNIMEYYIYKLYLINNIINNCINC